MGSEIVSTLGFLLCPLSMLIALLVGVVWTARRFLLPVYEVREALPVPQNAKAR
ncbi:hypothetical protein SAMN05443572_10759 [Myxococcus fulvus]|uniref:DUF2933 domain-containing protein n=1 Tax=Myxococcus fulvus TaxID=33 RepID=A0ABY1CMY3_MYXFU|nr:hypothetical protein SAMN05443572_10759 [Myxococcus fulvus]